MKKTENKQWLIEYRKLCKRSQQLQQQQTHALIVLMRKLPNEFPLDALSMDENNKENNDLKKSLTHLQSLIDTLINVITTNDSHASSSPQLLLDRVENQLCMFKNHQRDAYTKLAKEETLLSSQLQHVHRRLNTIRDDSITESQIQAKTRLLLLKSKTTTNNNNTTTKRKQKQPQRRRHQQLIQTTQVNDVNDEDLRDEMNAIDEYLGHDLYDGWTKDDHEHFIYVSRIYERNSTTQQQQQEAYAQEFIQRVILELPEYDENDVQQHIRWYTMYNRCEARKRELLQEWRKRQTERTKRKEAAKLREKEAQEHEILVLERRKQKEIAEKKALVQQWKDEKIQREAQQQQRKQEELQQQQQEQEQRRRRRLQRQKRRLQSAPPKETTVVKSRNRIKEREKNAALRRKALREIKKVSSEYHLKEHKKQEEMSLKNPPKSTNEYIRDPKRLLNLTHAQAQKQRQKNENNHRHNERGIQRPLSGARAIPQWRRGFF